ncbi:arf-GAP with dual PH domain-containing protein 1-like isoform X1 [Neopelma chrysocephalum]|uniref:arf-GAP with dual PH domain-containing protein 1-like isoform X1 n=1 Tax=Neopelma chrysocephalum TaxID=114329 RepID=UPI000FCD263A|nr:arf-GAP with dual PH domain-containing protein 1-like isoform X1 [Neopelma chrysocephalum]
MAGGNERSMRALKEVWKRAENSLCADCGKPDPDWASSTLGVFICLSCSGIHRNIPSISKVKSLKMDHWDDAQVQFLAKHGNAVTKATYEAHIPIYYYQPTYNDCQVLREQWIRAKYERKEFTELGKQLPYSDGVKEGILWKRGRDNGQFLPRKFLLSEREGCLKYFTKQDAKEPKLNVKIDVINATFQPEKIGNPNGLQITYLKDNKTRNIFVYHESGKEVVDWFNAIRSVQFHYLKVAFPIASDNEIKNRLTRNFLKEGYMEKTGPKQREAFKKRWFTLDHRRLMYFKDPLDAFAKGEVFVGSRENGYSVQKGLPSGTQGNFSWHYGITIVTPDREYLFTCETETDQLEWIKAFTSVINQAMTPQEYARNHSGTMTPLYLALWLSGEESRLTSEKHCALEAPLKHFCPHRMSTCFEGPIKLLPFKCKTLSLNLQYNLSLLNCCDLTGCWQVLPVNQALKTLALTMLDMGPIITPA